MSIPVSNAASDRLLDAALIVHYRCITHRTTQKYHPDCQVYSLLGRLDLLLKRREDVLRAYHREAEEGAREARALLASAKAQHHPGQAWGVPRPPNIRQILGRREG